MKIISPKVHGIIDYLFVLFLLASPTIFQMEGTLCTVTYALGIAHLIITLLTNFEMGLVKLIPFRIHGLIEVVVALAAAGLAFWFYNNGSDGFFFYIGLAVVIMIVFLLTDFKTTNPQANLR